MAGFRSPESGHRRVAPRSRTHRRRWNQIGHTRAPPVSDLNDQAVPKIVQPARLQVDQPTHSDPNSTSYLHLAESRAPAPLKSFRLNHRRAVSVREPLLESRAHAPPDPPSSCAGSERAHSCTAPKARRQVARPSPRRFFGCPPHQWSRRTPEKPDRDAISTAGVAFRASIARGAACRFQGLP